VTIKYPQKFCSPESLNERFLCAWALNCLLFFYITIIIIITSLFSDVKATIESIQQEVEKQVESISSNVDNVRLFILYGFFYLL